jgi:pimeloyl-ACP methyl ester carboxylesterase
MPVVDANGATFHYLQAGEGPDVVMLHGLTGSQAAWHLRIAPHLGRGRRITTYDLRGHGYSSLTPTGYSTRAMALDLAALLDAWGLDQVDLLGHSFGADVALHFALLWPARVRRLAVLEPVIPALLANRHLPDWPGWVQWVALIEQLTGAPVPAERRGDLRYLLGRSAEVPAMFGPARGLRRRQDRIRRLLDRTTLPQEYEQADELTIANLATLPHPKLLVYDDGSAWMSTCRVLRDVLTSCTTLLLPHAPLGHFAPLDAPEALLAALDAFLPPDPAVTLSAASAAAVAGR